MTSPALTSPASTGLIPAQPSAPCGEQFLTLLRFGTNPIDARAEGRRDALHNVTQVLSHTMDPALFDGYLADADSHSNPHYRQGYLETVRSLHSLLNQ